MAIEMKGRSVLDMTEGSVFKKLMVFAIPMMLGSIFQDLYSMVDMTVAGYTIGDNAIAAISSTDGLAVLMNYTCMGFSTGSAVLISQAFGMKDVKRIKQAYNTLIVLSLALSACIIGLFLSFLRPLMVFMNTPEELLQQATEYITVIIMFQFATQFYNMYASAFRALGNSKIPLMFLIVCSILNIILDILFMGVFHMGVRGAAIATVASQGISAVCSGFWFYRSYPELRSDSLKDFIDNCTLVREMVPMGLSVMATNALFAVGNLAVQGSLNSLGKDYLVANGAANKIRRFATVPSVGIANASATFVAQNYGAKKFDRIRKGARQAVLFSFCCNVVNMIIIVLTGKSIIRFITNTESEFIVEQGFFAITFVGAFIFTQTITMTYRMSIISMKRKTVPMIGTGVELCTRCLCAWVLTPVMGFPAICLAEPMSWIVSGVIMYICFLYVWKKDKAAAENCDALPA